jgi:DnaJ-class molecular chaperone
VAANRDGAKGRQHLHDLAMQAPRTSHMRRHVLQRQVETDTCGHLPSADALAAFAETTTGIEETAMQCPRCEGKGECAGSGYTYTCPRCDGHGTIVKPKR